METFWLIDIASVGETMPGTGDGTEATTSTDIK
jgi:hypothetical protein